VSDPDWHGGLEDDTENTRVSQRSRHYCHRQRHYVQNRIVWTSRGHSLSGAVLRSAKFAALLLRNFVGFSELIL